MRTVVYCNGFELDIEGTENDGVVITVSKTPDGCARDIILRHCDGEIDLSGIQVLVSP